MTGPYFHKPGWNPFICNGCQYDLTHLNEHEIQVCDSKKVDRRIAVTYTDHCFTQDRQPNDNLELIYPGSSRTSASFSLDRYTHSLSLPSHIHSIVDSKVWNVEGQLFALVPQTTSNGQEVFYAIIFSLDPVKGLPVHLHMRVRTAYPTIPNDTVITYGSIRFPHLTALRCQHKYPNRITDRNRQRPKLL